MKSSQQSVVLKTCGRVCEDSMTVEYGDITPLIMTIRGVQVMLDRDVAALYGVQTKALNQTVKRNIERFPDRFMFQLSKEEFEDWRSQIVTSNLGNERCHGDWRSQNVTSNYAKMGLRYRPYAFTEHGIMMLASMLKSDTAIQVSVRIVDAFVSMRRALASIAPILARIEETERRQLAERTERLTDRARNEERFAKIFDAMSDKEFPPQKVFFDGEFFDAFVQMKKFIRLAKRNLVVIDPYFDDSCLPLIAQKRSGVKVTIVRASKGAAKSLHAEDVAQFNRQYADSLTVKLTDKFHDRYLIIDNATLIHVGASLNCLGKRCFAFSTLDASFIPDIMSRVG